MERAECHSMSHSADMDSEPPKWPIAPDGYIPNSVIRSWRWKRRSRTVYWDETFLHDVHQVDEVTENNVGDVTRRIVWFTDDDKEEEDDEEEEEEKEEEKEEEEEKEKVEEKDKEDEEEEKEEEEEEEEEEKTVEVKRKKREKEDEKKIKQKVELELKERRDEKKEKEEDKIVPFVPVKQSNHIETETTLNKQLQTFPEVNVAPQKQEVDSKVLQTPCEETGHKPETPPLQHPSVPKIQRSSGFIREDQLESQVESPGLSAITAIPKIPKQELRSTTYEIQNPPPSPEDPKPQTELAPLESLPIRNQSFLLSSAKYDNIKDEVLVGLDQRVLVLYKKSKVSNKSLSPLAKLSEPSPTYRTPHSTVQTRTLDVNLKGESTCSLAKTESTSQTHFKTRTPDASLKGESTSQTHFKTRTPDVSLKDESTSQTHFKTRTPYVSLKDESTSQTHFKTRTPYVSLKGESTSQTNFKARTPDVSLKGESTSQTNFKARTPDVSLKGESTSQTNFKTRTSDVSVKGESTFQTHKEHLKTITPEVNVKGALDIHQANRALQSSTQTTSEEPKYQRQKPMPEWRKILYDSISVQGFHSPRAARFHAAQHPVKTSSVTQTATTFSSLQPGQAAAHQRVVQTTEFKDNLELASFYFYHVIPMASQHSFFTSEPCGKTQYGRLQFDWRRGSKEENHLIVSSDKPKHSAHTAVDKNKDFFNL